MRAHVGIVRLIKDLFVKWMDLNYCDSCVMKEERRVRGSKDSEWGSKCCVCGSVYCYTYIVEDNTPTAKVLV